MIFKILGDRKRNPEEYQKNCDTMRRILKHALNSTSEAMDQSIVEQWKAEVTKSYSKQLYWKTEIEFHEDLMSLISSMIKSLQRARE